MCIRDRRGKYGSELNFLIAGDTNEMKLDSILDISSDIRQVVTEPTRGNKLLDPVFTTLTKYYQQPQIKPPLDNDPDKNGRPSDHKIVLLYPISNLSFVSHIALRIKFLAKIWVKWFLAIPGDFQPNTEVPTK